MEPVENRAERACGRRQSQDRQPADGIVRPVAFLLAGLIAAALAACGTSPPLRYYTIEPSVPALDRTAASAAAAYQAPVLFMGSLQVPPAMDRLEMLRDVEAGRVEVRELDHWAAPLARSARLALAQDLAARMPPGALQFVGTPRGPRTAVLKVEILSFKVGGGVASMSAMWSVEPPAGAIEPDAGVGGTAGDAMAASRGDSVLQAAARAGALETARAWSTLLALLADDIVVKLGAPAR